MQDKRLFKLIYGSLLHDYGKLLYRANESAGKNHSEKGYNGLKELFSSWQTEGFLEDAKDILDCVRFHHYRYLNAVDTSIVRDDSLAYITYIADNMAAGTDRRPNEGDEQDAENNQKSSFEKYTLLEDIFNNFKKGTPRNKRFMPGIFSDTREGVIIPIETKNKSSEGDYKKIIAQTNENIKCTDLNISYLNSMISILENLWQYIPSSTNIKEACDISLYDHSRLSAAYASCIYHYLGEIGNYNYRDLLFEKAMDFYNSPAFLLVKFDISGVQDFIYTIHTKGAEKQLRARSFYLDMCLEVMADELLESVELSRANLLYTGGGGAYLLLPNTKKAKENLLNFEARTNKWLRESYGTGLYLAVAEKEFCSNTMYYDKNDNTDENGGQISAIYRAVTDAISKKKLRRYSATQIRELNSFGKHKGRECRVCHRVDESIKNEEDICTICSHMKKLGGVIQQKQATDRDKEDIGGIFYTMDLDIAINDNGKNEILEDKELALPISSNKILKYAESTDKMRKILEKENGVNVYSINTPSAGKGYATNLWVGNYFSKWDYTKYAEMGIGYDNLGIKRMAAMRLDIDDLGTAFISGFSSDNGKYNTLTRSATLSRNMSLFFKDHINKILKNKSGNYLDLRDENELENNGRDITIIYAGGDDVFLLGTWVDVIEFAIDFNSAFEDFSNKKLTLSAGIGLYGAKTSIPYIAEDTGCLETAAKNRKDNGELVKNAISLFEENSTYSWKDFRKKVLGEKYKLIKEFFEDQKERGQEKGMSFLYKLLVILRETETSSSSKSISTARLAYSLARLEPSKGKNKDRDEALKNDFIKFKEGVYKWSQNETDRKQLIDALQLYVFTKRKDKVDDGD